MIEASNITAAFANFRKLAPATIGGRAYAKQNFQCCGGCAVSALWEMFQEFNGKGRNQRMVGFAFYHKQDAYRMRKGDNLHIGYGGINEEGVSDESVSAAVGTLLVKCLIEQGCNVNWSGSVKDRIEVVA
jgi:hypothetical protein